MKKILVLFIWLMMWGLPTTANAEYKMVSNKNLEFCHKFLAYLNRKPKGYYYEKLLPDPEFPELTFPKLNELNKKEWLDRYKIACFESNKRFMKAVEGKREYENIWKRIESKDYWDEDFKLYFGSIDVNHDGALDNVLIKKDVSYSDSIKRTQSVFYVIDQDGYYDKKNKAHDYGDFFYHDGRFYFATTIPGLVVNLYEPKRRPFPESGFYWSGGGVCEFLEIKDNN